MQPREDPPPQPAQGDETGEEGAQPVNHHSGSLTNFEKVLTVADKGAICAKFGIGPRKLSRLLGKWQATAPAEPFISWLDRHVPPPIQAENVLPLARGRRRKHRGQRPKADPTFDAMLRNIG